MFDQVVHILKGVSELYYSWSVSGVLFYSICIKYSVIGCDLHKYKGRVLLFAAGTCHTIVHTRIQKLSIHKSSQAILRCIFHDQIFLSAIIKNVYKRNVSKIEWRRRSYECSIIYTWWYIEILLEVWDDCETLFIVCIVEFCNLVWFGFAQITNYCNVYTLCSIL